METLTILIINETFDFEVPIFSNKKNLNVYKPVHL